MPEVFVAAGRLSDALACHQRGEFHMAAKLLKLADDPAVRAFTELAWGKGAAARHGFIEVPDSPPYFARPERPKPRMPNSSTRKEVIARDGYHCRFCGIPVIDPSLRQLVTANYPHEVKWGTTNASQHAAFQCMWLQFDHVLPNSRGGDSSVENIVITCAGCNFGRMEATIEEARLLHPLQLEAPVAWEAHSEWDGLEGFRSSLLKPTSPLGLAPPV